MDIGHAANALRLGKRVRRDAWTADEWLILVPGSRITVTADRPLGIAAPQLVGQPVDYAAHIDKASLDGCNLGPWRPDGDDILADDWEIV